MIHRTARIGVGPICRTFYPRPLRLFSSRASEVRRPADEDQKNAREWLAKFGRDAIPRSIGQVSYSRSSGPGGQNVNKVNSKATLRVDLNLLRKEVPPLVFEQLKESRNYAENSDSLIIQADSSRKQSSNLEECYKKLADLILSAGKSVVKGETSPEQLAKIERLQKAENAARLKFKKMHSNKKSSRRSSFGSY